MAEHGKVKVTNLALVRRRPEFLLCLCPGTFLRIYSCAWMYVESELPFVAYKVYLPLVVKDSARVTGESGLAAASMEYE